MSSRRRSTLDASRVRHRRRSTKIIERILEVGEEAGQDSVILSQCRDHRAELQVLIEQLRKEECVLDVVVLLQL